MSNAGTPLRDRPTTEGSPTMTNAAARIRQSWYLMRLDQRLAWRLPARERRDVVRDVRGALGDGASLSSFGPARELAGGYTELRPVRLRPFGALGGAVVALFATWAVAMLVRQVVRASGGDVRSYVIGPFEDAVVELGVAVRVGAIPVLYLTTALLGAIVGMGLLLRAADALTGRQPGPARGSIVRRIAPAAGVLLLTAVALAPTTLALGAFQRTVRVPASALVRDRELGFVTIGAHGGVVAFPTAPDETSGVTPTTAVVDPVLAVDPPGGATVDPALPGAADASPAATGAPPAPALVQPAMVAFAGAPRPGEQLVAPNLVANSIGRPVVTSAAWVRGRDGEARSVTMATLLDRPGETAVADSDDPCVVSNLRLGGQCWDVRADELLVVSSGGVEGRIPFGLAAGTRLAGVTTVGVGDLDGRRGDELVVLAHVRDVSPAGIASHLAKLTLNENQVWLLHQDEGGWTGERILDKPVDWAVVEDLDGDGSLDVLAATASDAERVGSRLVWRSGTTKEVAAIGGVDLHRLDGGASGSSVPGRVLFNDGDSWVRELRLTRAGSKLRARVVEHDVSSVASGVVDAAFADLDGRGGPEIVAILRIRDLPDGKHRGSTSRLQVLGQAQGLLRTDCVIDLDGFEPMVIDDVRTFEGSRRELLAITGFSRERGMYQGFDLFDGPSWSQTWVGAKTGRCIDHAVQPGSASLAM